MKANHARELALGSLEGAERVKHQKRLAQLARETQQYEDLIYAVEQQIKESAEEGFFVAEIDINFLLMRFCGMTHQYSMKFPPVEQMFEELSDRGYNVKVQTYLDTFDGTFRVSF